MRLSAGTWVAVAVRKAELPFRDVGSIRFLFVTSSSKLVDAIDARRHWSHNDARQLIGARHAPFNPEAGIVGCK
jgi:hypothetical protein